MCLSEAAETTAFLHVDTDTTHGISHIKVGISALTSSWSCHSCPLIAFKWCCFFDCIIDRVLGQCQQECPSMWETLCVGNVPRVFLVWLSLDMIFYLILPIESNIFFTLREPCQGIWKLSIKYTFGEKYSGPYSWRSHGVAMGEHGCPQPEGSCWLGASRELWEWGVLLFKSRLFSGKHEQDFQKIISIS